MKPSRNKRAQSTSYSFTAPVVRVLKNEAKEKHKRRHTATIRQKAGTIGSIKVFHKRRNKSDEADILRTTDLSSWRKSAGRQKSWRACQRVRLTTDLLELLMSSNGHPVSFGWQFSKGVMSAMFVRGQGQCVNQQPKNRKRRVLSRKSAIRDLDETCNLQRPLWRYPFASFSQRHPDSNARGALEEVPKRFLRLNITREAIDITTEVHLEGERLTMHPPLRHHRDIQGSDKNSKQLIVRCLVRNDSHADVYLVQKYNRCCDYYLAHEFLSEGLSKNGLASMRRRADRLRRSSDYYAETLQRGQKIIVMRPAPQANNTYNVRYTEREFPPLPGRSKKSNNSHPSLLKISSDANGYLLTAVEPCKLGRKKYRRSYASVIKEPTRKRTIKSNHIAYRKWQERQGNVDVKKGHGKLRQKLMHQSKMESEAQNEENEEKAWTVVRY